MTDTLTLGEHVWCQGCVRAFGRFAARAPFEQRARVWRVATARDAVVDESRLGVLVDDRHLAFYRDGVDRVARDSDAATHFELGVAFREMGLIDSALAEMGSALALHQRGPLAERALQMLVEPRLLLSDLETLLPQLRELVFAN